MNENLPPLFFYNFFQRVKHELGYSRSVGKYMEFCIVIATGAVRFGAGPEQPEMLQFLKVFLLENERHRADFERIFLEELDAEVLRMRSAFDKKFTPEAPVLDENKEADFSKKTDPLPADLSENTPPIQSGIVDNLKEKAPKETETIEEKEKTDDFWFMLGHEDPNEKLQPSPEKPPQTAHFNLSDEYFPLTRRELMKTWQYLRLRCPAGVSGQLDIGATVKQVARDGFFMNPVFEKNWATRPDALLILADRDDAMTPFHELINRITSTALDPMAHPQAGVWYFHKYPNNWLYKKPTLTDAHEIGKALRPYNEQNTLALIISDGGAARGEPRDAERVAGMSDFLKKLRKKVAYVAWLNPIPRRRWAGTAAEQISKDLQIPMFPALDGDGGGFSQVIQSLMEQKGA